jgi:arylsulfatase A-like enzyme
MEGEMADQRPNLLFIMTDHQRADSLKMVQAGLEVTPNLNRLASQGTAFSRAYNTCPLCVPARTALATGKYPTSNGVVFNDWRGVRAGDHRPFHQVLAQAGYDVGHIGVHHIRVRPELRERVSFVRWVDNDDYARYLGGQGLDAVPPESRQAFRKRVVERQEGASVEMGYSNTRTSVWPHAAEHFKDSYFCQQGVAFLQGQRDRPFALFVYLWAPHPPLWVPEPFASLFPADTINLPVNVGVRSEGEPPGRRRGIAAQLGEDVSARQWREVWAAHLGLVHMADAGIGRMLRALQASGHDDDTVVVFTVDHGDHLGQHRMYQKMEMYEQAIRVPLIVRAPGARPQACDTPVSHLDVVPTLCDLMGLGKPDDLEGISIADTVLSGRPPLERSLFCQYSGNPTVGDIRRTAITRRFKYTYTPGDMPELYDLVDDPLEMRNIVADPAYASVVKELHQAARSWAESHGDWVAS